MAHMPAPALPVRSGGNLLPLGDASETSWAEGILGRFAGLGEDAPLLTKATAAEIFERLARESGVAAGKLRAQLIPESTWKRAGEKLGPSASETVWRLAHVLSVAERIWQSERDAIRFVLRPHVELGQKTPYALLHTESGGRRVENLLGALEYGFPV